jgi:hypothetical protein
MASKFSRKQCLNVMGMIHTISILINISFIISGGEEPLTTKLERKLTPDKSKNKA